MPEKKELDIEQLDKVSGGWAGNPGGDPISYSDPVTWDEIKNLYINQEIFFIEETTWFIATVYECFTIHNTQYYHFKIRLSNNRHDRIPNSTYKENASNFACFLHCTFKDGSGI